MNNEDIKYAKLSVSHRRLNKKFVSFNIQNKKIFDAAKAWKLCKNNDKKMETTHRKV